MRLPKVLVFCALFLAGCSSAPTQPPTTPAATTAAPTVPVSVNALMVDFIDHASHALWDAERESAAPKTDAEWKALDRHATQLAAAGALIALGGTGPSDRLWASRADWQKISAEMGNVGLAAGRAIKAKDLAALITANGELVATCERCHQAFKPDAPTEGLTHIAEH